MQYMHNEIIAVQELIGDPQRVIAGGVPRAFVVDAAQRAIAWLETLDISNDCLMREVAELRERMHE